jgi:hypothetical protein
MVICSQDLLLRSFRRSFRRRGILDSSGSVGGSVANHSGGIANRSGGSINSRRHLGRGGSSCIFSDSSSFFLLATAGTQHEGNRNGAPNLCIHRQLPQVRSVRKGWSSPRPKHRLFCSVPRRAAEF